MVAGRATAVFGQTAPPAAAVAGAVAQPSPQALNPAQLAPPSAARTRSDDDLLASPEAGPCPLANSSLRFVLRSVEFAGAFKVRMRDLAPAYAAAIGNEIGLAEVCRIRDVAGEILFRQGVLARVEVPEQRIEDGRLKLAVIEAHVVSVQVRGDAGPAQERIESFVEKLRGMRPFDIREAQRYLLLASDVPGVRISAALRPNPEGMGAVDLIVTVSRKPVDALVNVQNLGSQALGRFGGVARVDFNGFTRFGERTSLVVYSTLANQEQQVVELLSEARLGDEGLTAKGSASYGISDPGAQLAPLHLDGRSLVLSGGLYYPLIRLRRTNVNLGGGFDLIDQKTNFKQGGVLSEDHLRVFFAHVDADRQWRPVNAFLPGGDIGGDIDVRRGVNGLGSSAPGEKDLSRIGGRPDGLVVRGDAHLDLALLTKLLGHMSISGQYSETPLLAYEQFAVGDLTVGRGYDPSALTGDEGLGGSIELRAGQFSPPAAWKLPNDMNVGVFAFYDIAAVFNHEVGSESRTVRSAGGGFNLRLTSRVGLDVSYAHPFDKTSTFVASAPSSRVLVSLTMSIL